MTITGQAAGTWALLPVKSFRRAKSRLAPVLDGAARAALAERLFDHVIGVLLEARELDGVLVVTDGDEVARAAQARGAHAIADGCAGPLGRIVDGGLAALSARHAGAALVLMSDLPELAAAGVAALLGALALHDLVVAPDLAGDGTNALALRPPSAIATCFGRADSYRAHRAAGAAAGLRVAALFNAELGFDVDSPDDYRALLTRAARDPRRGPA